MADELEAFLEQHARPALVAKEYPASRGSSIVSRQGPPLGLPGEEWPRKDGEPLVPILSVYVPELPFVPHFLAAWTYWTFFIQREPYEHLARDGSLVIRQSMSIANLVPMNPPPGIKTDPSILEFHEVRDYPCATALGEIFADYPRLGRDYFAHERAMSERFPCHYGIKLGGYPYLIQETYFLKQLNPPFSIQLDISEYFHKGDSGIGYLDEKLDYAAWETI